MRIRAAAQRHVLPASSQQPVFLHGRHRMLDQRGVERHLESVPGIETSGRRRGGVIVEGGGRRQYKQQQRHRQQPHRRPRPTAHTNRIEGASCNF
eukprot:SAG31_NODE_3098_length_4678_cov_2.509282_4_plen_95_part_00